jgi:hypothetical protein
MEDYSVERRLEPVRAFIKPKNPLEDLVWEGAAVSIVCGGIGARSFFGV